MGFYFVPRPEPLSPAKRLEMVLLMRRTRCDSAEIGPKTGPKNRRRAAGATPPDASKPASQLGSSSGASRTRTGGLLGAIQRGFRLLRSQSRRLAGALRSSRRRAPARMSADNRGFPLDSGTLGDGCQNTVALEAAVG